MLKGQWFTGFEDLTDCHSIRRTVFVEEKGVPESEEFDGTDESAFHLVIYEDEAPVGTGRVLLLNDETVLGRVAVLPAFRGKGYGDFIVRLLIRAAFDMGAERQYVHAELSAQGFYEKLGFSAFGDEFVETGLKRIAMVHDGDIGSH